MTTFAGLLGQEQAIELLTQAVVQNRVAPAYLFVGATGIGRSLAAERFIELLFSQGTRDVATLRHRIQQRNHPDLLWVEPTYLHQGKRISASEAVSQGIKRKSAPQIRLEQIREISQFLGRPPLEAVRSIVVLEQAETMAEPAANGLLKTLEEPGQATLVLIAPNVESLLPTLVSRCQRIPFHRLSSEALTHVLQSAGCEEVLHYPDVLAAAQGSPGSAIGHFIQLQAIPPDLLQSLAHTPRTTRVALELARQIDKTLDTEAQLWLIDYLQQVYWQKFAPQVSATLLLQLQCLEKARQSLLSYVQPRLVWEVTLMAIGNGG